MLYNLKEVAKRGTAFAGAVGLVSALALTMLPSVSFADALNPLTDRSLTLSSSSPGWAYTDGSGNPTYAAPGTGPNGQKTGETFNFRVSTDSTVANGGPAVKAFTFQYCTSPAGTCIAPGNGPATAGGQTSNLDVHYSGTLTEGTDFEVYVANDALDHNNGTPYAYNDTTNVTASDGWTMTAGQWFDQAANSATDQTENNYFTLVQDGTGATAVTPVPGTQIWVKLFASADNYVTNPGGIEEPFFVRMNDYKSTTNLLSKTNATDDSDVIDGGVTVANVMNQSIHITTKVLETMTFSVGTSNPDFNSTSTLTHGACDTLWHTPSDQIPGATDLTDQQSSDWDLIKLGNPLTEYSLSPTTAYDANSWWRLSTNSSAGATVYYSGETLTNTEGDWITAIGENKSAEANAQATPVAVDNSGDGFTAWNEPKASHPGDEQFGLALDQRTVTPVSGVGNDDSLAPLIAAPAYADGGAGDAAITLDGGAKFAFNRNSLTTPEPLASESNSVINCSTGKVRYLANIEAATPAGVYTTKINYIAAPQY
jgi:hypothetical protein